PAMTFACLTDGGYAKQCACVVMQERKESEPRIYTDQHRTLLTCHSEPLGVAPCAAKGCEESAVHSQIQMSSIELETRNAKTETDLRELAQDIVHRAINGGATAAECVVREGDEFSTLVRLGQVETLKESGSKAIGVRVFNGKRAASTYSSDFSHNGLDRMLKSALELSRITSEDPYAG